MIICTAEQTRIQGYEGAGAALHPKQDYCFVRLIIVLPNVSNNLTKYVKKFTLRTTFFLGSSAKCFQSRI